MQELSPYLDSPAKRTLDVLIGIMLLIPTVLVVLVVLTMVLICDGWSPLLFQPRVGKDGRLFRIPKVRTMRPNRVTGELQSTLIGRFLRRHRVDELPQLLSVFSGKVSLVGPRPELPEIVRSYDHNHRRRLSVTPGLTGIWQMRASRRKNIHQEMAYDLLYLREASFCLDMKILASTVLFVLRGGPDSQ